MSFKNFRFIDTQTKTIIECTKAGCSAPEADYSTDQGKTLYSKSAYVNPVNDCNSDVTLTCNSCGNSETVEGVPGIHL